jgi:diadenosine tetraphosphate (Ap4A) HIT family hydrolase
VSFALHPQLAADTIPLGDLPLCRLLLMNNRHFPWLILVPRREGLRELFDLTPEDYQRAMQEIRQIMEHFSLVTKAHKMNVAALGNQVPQLHIHVIARKHDDAAWPQPVWNARIPPEPYDSKALDDMVQRVKKGLNITKM